MSKNSCIINHYAIQISWYSFTCRPRDEFSRRGAANLDRRKRPRIKGNIFEAKRHHRLAPPRKGAGTVQIPKKTLSEADQKHLETLTNLPGQGERFDTRTLGASSWKARPGGFEFDKLRYLSAYESDHFIVLADSKVREKILASYAEAAERLWVDMATDLPMLKDSFKGRKMLIVLADGEEDAKIFESWHKGHAERTNLSGFFRVGTYTIVTFRLDSDLADKAGLASSGRLFRTDVKKAQNIRLKWQQRIHFLASEILSVALRPTRNHDGYTLSMLGLSHSFHRESIICGAIETAVSFGGGDGIEGFSNGRNWASPTRKLLSKGARPSIESYLKKQGSDAAPRDLGFGHGLMCFIHHNPIRLAGFNKVLETAVSDEKVPTAESFAKGLGYDSPAALDAAWLKFMQSDEF